jgi:Tfp pilus assembly protein PilP
MKLTTSILAIAVMAGGAWAQNPDAIDNARSVAKSLQQKQANDTNAALNAAGVPAKPAPGQATPMPAGQQPAPAAFVPARNSTKPVFAAAPPVSAASKPAMKRTNAAKKSPVDAAARASKSRAAKVRIAATTEVKAAPEATKALDASKQPQSEEKKWAMNGKRDPFFSPVVQQAGGSGCSTGKKCLEIGHINVRGVVKSDTGFIAVVTNDLNKAYFLRENDPVFNGYVVRITGDSVVFQETVQDKLGKPFTREITKRIFTPAV